MTEPDNNTAETEGPAVTLPGKQLREAREARGLTLPETAIKLHLHQRMLRALEADDYDQLPSPIYVRGYLRNYARLLDLDPEHIVAAYDGSEDEHIELKPPLKAPSQVTSSDRPVKAVTYLLTLALVLLLLAWWQSRNISDDGFMDFENMQVSDNGNADGTPSAREGGEEHVQSDSLGYPVRIVRHPDTAFYPRPSEQPAPGSEAVATTRTTPADTATTPAKLLETLPDMDDGQAGEPTDTAAAAETAAGEPPGTAPADSSEGLRLELTEESWIEVYDAAGQRLHLGLGKPGEVIQVDGPTPLRVVLGYAPGVSVRFNGETVDTIEHSQAGVAQFTVGN